MPIDPRIPLQVQSPNLMSLGDLMDQVNRSKVAQSQLASIGQQRELTGLQLESARAEQEAATRRKRDMDLVQGAIGAAGGNVSEALEATRGEISPDLMLDLQKRVNEANAAELSVFNSAMQADLNRRTTFARAFRGVQTQEDWDAAISDLSQVPGIDVSKIPSRFSADWRDRTL